MNRKKRLWSKIEKSESSLSARNDAECSTSTIRYLTKAQRDDIVQTWKAIPDKTQLGREIHLHVFAQKPNLKVVIITVQK